MTTADDMLRRFISMWEQACLQEANKYPGLIVRPTHAVGDALYAAIKEMGDDCEPQLGCATTRQLLEELAARGRCEVFHAQEGTMLAIGATDLLTILGIAMLDYRTVDSMTKDNDVVLTYKEPHDRLTYLTTVMTDALDAALTPEETEVKAIVFLDDGKRGGIQIHGYEELSAAMADLLVHMRAIMKSMGKNLDIMFVGDDGVDRV